jgi:hypothetical protein
LYINNFNPDFNNKDKTDFINSFFSTVGFFNSRFALLFLSANSITLSTVINCAFENYSLLVDKVGLNENRQAVADGQEAKSL